MITVGELVKRSVQYAQEKNSNVERFEVELLIAHYLGLKRLDLYLSHEKPVEEVELLPIRIGLKQLIQDKPLAYILGSSQFCGLQIEVTPAVLIPRQETELLVEHTCQYINSQPYQNQSRSSLKVVDLCCGSGAIGIAIKKRFEDVQVIAADISIEALQVAQQNASRLGVGIEFVQGDLFKDLFEKIDLETVDILLSNPPYIREDEFFGLESCVRDYEPKIALVSGVTGLEVYERIAKVLQQKRKKDLLLGLEVGYTQAVQVKSLFSGIFESCEVISDYNGHNRHLFFK